MASAASSYIKTTTVVDTRTRDQLSFPFTARPQAMTVYTRFVEMGTIEVPGARLWEVAAADASPRMFLFRSVGSAVYSFSHSNAFGVAATCTLAAAPSIGQGVEIRCVINTNGSTMVGQSINGAAETTAASGTAVSFGQTWSGNILYLNQSGISSNGFVAFRDIKIVAGVKTMQEMRRLAGTD